MVRYNAKLQRIARAVKRDIDEIITPLIKQYAPEYVQDEGLGTTMQPLYSGAFSGNNGEKPSIGHHHVSLDGWADTISRALQFLIGKWASPFIRQSAESIASDFVRGEIKRNDRGRRSVGIDVFGNSQQMRDYLEAATFQNTMLITSIPAQYLEQVQNIVMTNMRAGMRPSYIEKALQEQFGVTARRAKMIARDQTAKVQGDINEKRQRAAGFEYFQWLDSKDQRVRHRHHVLATQVTAYGIGVYRWTDLPLSDKGEPIKPGQDYQCRCVAKATTQSQVEKYKRTV